MSFQLIYTISYAHSFSKYLSSLIDYTRRYFLFLCTVIIVMLGKIIHYFPISYYGIIPTYYIEIYFYCYHVVIGVQ